MALLEEPKGGQSSRAQRGTERDRETSGRSLLGLDLQGFVGMEEFLDVILKAVES